MMMICNTPVEDGVVRCWYALSVKVSDSRADDAGVSMARTYQDVALDAFAQDFELWQHKQPALTILQVPDDGPFHKGRIWHRQFYNPPRQGSGRPWARQRRAHVHRQPARSQVPRRLMMR